MEINDDDSGDNSINNKTFGKRSNLYRSTSNDHSQRRKKSAVEQRLQINKNNYWGNVSSQCNSFEDGNCLLNYLNNDWNTMRVVAKAKFNELNSLTKTEHNSNVHNNLISLSTKHNKSNSHTIYKVSLSQGEQVECCKQCYMRFNYITKSQLENSKKINKLGNHIDINKRKERSRADGPVIDMNGSEFNKVLKKYNINNPKFIDVYLPYAFAPQGDTNEYCLQWMNRYFDKYGDQQPNSYITYLSEAFKRDIYDQYHKHVSSHHMEAISRDAFYRMWVNCFPYKMLRDECNIVGKCQICARATELRMSKDAIKQEVGKEMHMLHKSMFKGERDELASRVQHSLENPGRIMHLLIDIMDFWKFQTPYAGTQYTFSKCFDSVIVGAYMYGDSSAENSADWKRLRLHRTWNSVGKTCNLIIHVFLKSMEEWMSLHNGRTPDIIYLQVDGGGENANNAFLSLLQFIVSQNYCNQLLFSRLPTGHGHTEGDGGFGLIKVIIKNAVLAGWDSFEKEVMLRLGEGLSNLNCSVENIYIVKDYEAFIKPYRSDCNALHKRALTQHQILFERVENDIDYPFMVKISVRAYCKQSVIEFIPATNAPLTEMGKESGFDPVELLVQWFSVSSEGNSLTFLKDIPLPSKVPFFPLVDNCVSLIDEVMAEIRNSRFPIITDEIKESYETWRQAYLPFENDMNDLDGYAERIGEVSPLFALFETRILPYTPSERLNARVTSFTDEEFSRKYDTLHAVSIPSVGLSESRSRAFQVESQVAADITTKIKGTPLVPSAHFLSLENYISRNHKNFATFYEERCKFSIHGSIRYVKAKVVADTGKAVSSYLGSFISRLYTPLLKSFEDHVERVLSDKQSTDVVSCFELEGKRHKLSARDITSFGVGTINMLMYLFNMREAELFKAYANLKKPAVYTKSYFCCAEAIVAIFDHQKTGSLAALEVYSQVILPYRQAHGSSRYSISLVIVIPKEKRLFLLDLYRSRDDAKLVLPVIKREFDRYYDKTFTVELYSTIPETAGVIDSFQRLDFLSFSNDQPIIYMYVAIYYVLFGCPLIFDAADISNKYFQDRIKYEMLKKMLFL